MHMTRALYCHDASQVKLDMVMDTYAVQLFFMKCVFSNWSLFSLELPVVEILELVPR